MPDLRPTRTNKGTVVLAVLGLGALITVVFLARGIVAEIRLLASANDDNMQWSVTQAEVEYLDFRNRVSIVANKIDADADLTELRRRFDVFYSRITLLARAPVYATLREDPVYAVALDNLVQYVNRSVAIIDSPDPVLRAALPDLETDTVALRPDLRRLVTASLQTFVAAAARQRIDIATTLTQLAVLVSALGVASGLMMLNMRRINRQNLRRGQEIEQASHRLNTVISTALDAVIVTDGAGRILEFNHAAEKMFGHGRSEVLGRDLAEVILPDSERTAAARSSGHDGDAVLGRGGRMTRNMQRRDGTVFPVELAVRAAPTQDGEIVIAFLRDVSRRVKAEADMIAARDQALAGERAKSDFLAVMSHEIRTPLNGLLGNLSLLRDTDLNARQAAFIDTMEASGRLLMRHVSDVLDITRYDAGRFDLKPEVIKTADLLQELIDNQRGLALVNGTDLTWRWRGAPLPWIETDRGRLEHILLNLISNAVKFTRDGHVTVEGEIVEDRPDIPLVEIRVRDTGTGIAADQLTRIFEDFVTGDLSNDRIAGGTGLGLGIVQRFARAMKGDVSVESTPGEGSLFRVRLPLKRAAVPVHPRPGANLAHAVAASPPLDVLVVEDNEINRQVTREMLARLGHRVVEAHTGREGVDRANARAFDLILMDISMPVLDGRAATREIRHSNGASRHTPIVALTANVMPDERAAFASDGMNDVLHKPLTRDALAATIAALAPSASESRNAIVDHAQLQELRATLGEAPSAAFYLRFQTEVEALMAWLGTGAMPPLSEVQSRAHRTAGSAAMFGAVGLRRALIALEDAARIDDSGAAKSARAPLADLWTSTRAILDP